MNYALTNWEILSVTAKIRDMKYLILICLVSLSIQNLAIGQESALFTNSTEAKEYANKNEANILMVFSGSDWCRPCIQFKKDILMSEEFLVATKNKTAVLYLDFPSKKKNKLNKEQTEHNEMWAEQYNKSGAFPQIVLLDNKMNKIKDMKFSGQSAEEFLSELYE